MNETLNLQMVFRGAHIRALAAPPFIVTILPVAMYVMDSIL